MSPAHRAERWRGGWGVRPTPLAFACGRLFSRTRRRGPIPRTGCAPTTHQTTHQGAKWRGRCRPRHLIFPAIAKEFAGDPGGTRTHNPLIKSHSTAPLRFRIATPFFVSWYGIFVSSRVADCPRKSPIVASATPQTTHQTGRRMAVSEAALAPPIRFSGVADRDLQSAWM